LSIAKILIASDDKTTLRNIKTWLDKLDFSVCGVVNNRTEAIWHVKEFTPDLILIDTHLNDYEDGIETARYLSDTYHVPHVFISTDQDEETIERSKSTNPYGFILKPVNIRDLNACLKTALFRYQSEQKLKESEEKYIRLAELLETQKEEYKLIFEAMPVMVLVKDRTGNIIRVNNLAAKFIGHKAEEMEGKPLASFFPDEAEKYLEEDNIVLKTGKPFTGIFEEYINKKNIKKIIRYDKYPYMDSIGNINGIIVMAQDITRQKEMEEKIAEIEQKNSVLINTIPDLLFEYDKNGKHLDFRANHPEDLFVQPDKFLGKTVMEVLPEEIKRPYLEYIKKAYSSGEMHIMEYSLNIKGENKDFEARFIKSGNNRVLSIIRDITDKKIIENALRESEDRYRSFIEHSSEGIYRVEFKKPIPVNLPVDKQMEIYGSSSYIAECNDEFARMYGLNNAEEVTGFVNNVYRDLNRNEILLLRKHLLTNNYTIVDLETEEKDKNGNVKWFLNNAQGVVENGNLVRVWGIQRDITSKKMADFALQSSLLEKEILLKEIHHRVKNNLQIVTSLLKLQGKYITDEKALKLLKDSKDRIHSMSIIHQKLYQSKDLSHLDFHEYISTIITHLQHSYGILRDRVKIQINAEDIIMPIDNAIPAGLIINELVSNSFKYAFPGDSKGNISINVAYEKLNREFWISVRDDGIGFPEDININKSTTFGLTLVNLLIQQMGGTLELVRSGGSEFRFSFRDSDYKQRA
jgi:PAS domain S-box-containing protein